MRLILEKTQRQKIIEEVRLAEKANPLNKVQRVELNPAEWRKLTRELRLSSRIERILIPMPPEPGRVHSFSPEDEIVRGGTRAIECYQDNENFGWRDFL